MTHIKWNQPDQIDLIREAVEAAMEEDFVLEKADFNRPSHSEAWGNMALFCNNLDRELNLRSRTEAPAEPAVSRELVERMVLLLRRVTKAGRGWTIADKDDAAAILAELEPKPDPLRETVREAIHASVALRKDETWEDRLTAELRKRGIKQGEAK